MAMPDAFRTSDAVRTAPGMVVLVVLPRGPVGAYRGAGAGGGGSLVAGWDRKHDFSHSKGSHLQPTAKGIQAWTKTRTRKPKTRSSMYNIFRQARVL